MYRHRWMLTWPFLLAAAVPCRAETFTDPDPDVASASRPSSQAKAATRLWKDRTGKFTVEAQYLGVADNQVRLRRADGLEIRVPLERLSESDQEFVSQVRQTGNAADSSAAAPKADNSAAKRGASDEPTIARGIDAPRLYPIKQGDKYGYMAKTGKIMVQSQFDEARDFCEGLGRIGVLVEHPTKPRVRVGRTNETVPNLIKKYGFIDAAGRVVIEPQFSAAEDFSCGFARISHPSSLSSVGDYGDMVSASRAKEHMQTLFSCIDDTGKKCFEHRADGATSIAPAEWSSSHDLLRYAISPKDLPACA